MKDLFNGIPIDFTYRTIVKLWENPTLHGSYFYSKFLTILWSVSKYKTCNWAKIGFYLFQPNFPKNASCLKLLWDIHLFWNSIFKKIEFYPFQPNFPENASYLKLLWDIHLFWNSIFKKIEFQWKFQFGENQVVWKNLHFLEWNLNFMQFFFFFLSLIA